MNRDPLYFLTIDKASSMIQSKELSPVELTTSFLERITGVDQETLCYLEVLSKSALEEARQAENEIISGQYRGPLHGIPLAHKDLYDTQGVRTTGQSKVFEHRIPDQDCTAIARLKAAGAINLGKLAMYEFAMGGPETSLAQQARNPWNTAYMTSGSSSGSGAAVAAGLCMGSLGSDTGGSIRGPAAFCGIVGLKPTYGRVSRSGVIPLSASLDHCGPMTWTAEDCAHILKVISGYDPQDPTSSREPVPNYRDSLTEDISDLVIGVPTHYFYDVNSGVDAETLELTKKAVIDLEKLGAKIEEVKIPFIEYSQISNVVMLMTEAFTYHLPNLRSQPQNFGKAFLDRVYLGGVFSGTDYAQASRVRGLITKSFSAVMNKVDLIAGPTWAKAPGKFGQYDKLSMAKTPNFTSPFNQTGMPAISVPCGFNKEGLPIGLQLAGKPFHEATVLRAAYAYQRYARLYEMRPTL